MNTFVMAICIQPLPMRVPPAYAESYLKNYGSLKGVSEKYEQSRRSWINGYSAALQGKDLDLKPETRADMERRYPDWETQLMAAKDWEEMWYESPNLKPSAKL